MYYMSIFRLQVNFITRGKHITLNREISLLKFFRGCPKQRKVYTHMQKLLYSEKTAGVVAIC